MPCPQTPRLVFFMVSVLAVSVSGARLGLVGAREPFRRLSMKYGRLSIILAYMQINSYLWGIIKASF